MADQYSSNELAPSLQAVLSSLNVNLEEELNRYRRNRVLENISAAEDASDDVFAAIEDEAFDIDPITTSAAARLAISPAPGTPPPLPPNKKLLATESAIANETSNETSVATDYRSGSLLAGNPVTQTAAGSEPAFENEFARLNIAGPGFATPNLANASPAAPITDLFGSDPSTVLNATGTPGLSLSTQPDTSSTNSSNTYSSNNGYLASSEKLIESLNEASSMPEPVDTTFKPKRKTVSLLAGATLGFLGLVAGLGASYLMSNPMVAQRLATGFSGSESVTTATNTQTFDPPGPDLSAQEFVDIDIDNLSSLNMPRTAVDPLSSPAGLSSPTPLPPIANPSAVAQGPGGSPGSQPGLAPNTETQASVVPAGGNFYVTVPFTTEQALADVRQTVDEAFVRQFSDGNLVQLAAFDNAATAQQFVAELQAQGVTAQVYGPTAE